MSIVPHDTDAHTAHLVSTALNFAGAFGLSAPFSASAATTLRGEGRLRQLVVVLAQQAWSAFPPLNWSVAIPSADETLHLARETGQPLWEASALIVQAILAGVRGDFDQAESQTAAAEAIALPMGANAMLCGLQLTRGLTAVSAGKYDEAFEQLHRLFDPSDPAYHHFQSAWALGDLAEAALHTGNLEAARFSWTSSHHEPRPVSPPGPRSRCCMPGHFWPTTSMPRSCSRRLCRRSCPCGPSTGPDCS